MPDNSKNNPKNTYSRRSALKNQRLPLASRKFTAHRFKQWRKLRGMIVREMRLVRGLYQADIGAPSQIRLFENGKVAQITTMEILARLVPCPREFLKFVKAMLQNLPVACLKCRAVCTFRGQDDATMLRPTLQEITDFDFEG